MALWQCVEGRIASTLCLAPWFLVNSSDLAGTSRRSRLLGERAREEEAAALMLLDRIHGRDDSSAVSTGQIQLRGDQLPRIVVLAEPLQLAPRRGSATNDRLGPTHDARTKASPPRPRRACALGLEHEQARAQYLVDKVRRDARRRRAFKSPPGSTDVAWLLATEFDSNSER